MISNSLFKLNQIGNPSKCVHNSYTTTQQRREVSAKMHDIVTLLFAIGHPPNMLPITAYNPLKGVISIAGGFNIRCNPDKKDPFFKCEIGKYGNNALLNRFDKNLRININIKDRNYVFSNNITRVTQKDALFLWNGQSLQNFKNYINLDQKILNRNVVTMSNEAKFKLRDKTTFNNNKVLNSFANISNTYVENFDITNFNKQNSNNNNTNPYDNRAKTMDNNNSNKNNNNNNNNNNNIEQNLPDQDLINETTNLNDSIYAPYSPNVSYAQRAKQNQNQSQNYGPIRSFNNNNNNKNDNTNENKLNPFSFNGNSINEETIQTALNTAQKSIITNLEKWTKPNEDENEKKEMDENSSSDRDVAEVEMDVNMDPKQRILNLIENNQHFECDGKIDENELIEMTKRSKLLKDVADYYKSKMREVLDNELNKKYKMEIEIKNMNENTDFKDDKILQLHAIKQAELALKIKDLEFSIRGIEDNATKIKDFSQRDVLIDFINKNGMNEAKTEIENAAFSIHAECKKHENIYDFSYVAPDEVTISKCVANLQFLFLKNLNEKERKRILNDKNSVINNNRMLRKFITDNSSIKKLINEKKKYSYNHSDAFHNFIPYETDYFYDRIDKRDITRCDDHFWTKMICIAMGRDMKLSLEDMPCLILKNVNIYNHSDFMAFWYKMVKIVKESDIDDLVEFIELFDNDDYIRHIVYSPEYEYTINHERKNLK